jgi:hypothetical protein
MNNFSFNRFGQTFRWVLVTHFQTFLAFTAGCAAAMFLLEMIIIALNIHPDGGNYISVLYSDLSSFCAIFLIIYALVAISTLFSYYLKKPQREAFLMLPSTNLEKFLAVVIYVTVVWSLAGFLAFAVGDTLRMAVRALAFGNEWYSLVPRVLDMLGDIKPSFFTGGLIIQTTLYKVCYSVVFFSILFWIHSAYILGGTLLRKYTFVVTSLVIILAIVLTVWVASKINLEFFYIDTLVDGQSVFHSENIIPEYIEMTRTKNVQFFHKVGALGYIIAVLLPLLTIFNYWASFHIFKSFQLITNKWTNYDFHK